MLAHDVFRTRAALRQPIEQGVLFHLKNDQIHSELYTPIRPVFTPTRVRRTIMGPGVDEANAGVPPLFLLST